MSVFKDGAYYPLGTGGEMSEGEYEYQFQMVQDAGERDFSDEIDRYDDEYPDVTTKGLWFSRDGIIRIADMTDAHLRNAIRLFERSGKPGLDDKLTELREEATRRFLRSVDG